MTKCWLHSMWTHRHVFKHPQSNVVIKAQIKAKVTYLSTAHIIHIVHNFFIICSWDIFSIQLLHILDPCNVKNTFTLVCNQLQNLVILKNLVKCLFCLCYFLFQSNKSCDIASQRAKPHLFLSVTPILFAFWCNKSICFMPLSKVLWPYIMYSLAFGRPLMQQ